MSYNNPIYSTYTLRAATVSTAATLLTIIGPPGKTGRLDAVGSVVTTGVTEAANVINVGSATDADAYGTLTQAISAAGTATNAAVIGDADDNLIPADSKVLVATTGACTAGAADLFISIAWF
jgi:hypothetical protein